ncbi:hypothetical protein FOA52_001199 [Chlamydomonas sp. UWO 241]|nr:hypothetical protein FOA52_001199 [Chlamydomonas sp. UWO 241]
MARRLRLTKKASRSTGHMYEVSLVGRTTIVGVPADAACGLCVVNAACAAVGGAWGWALAAALLAAVAAYVGATAVTRERLTVLRRMGVFTESFMRCGVRSDLQFVDLERVAGVLITEGLTHNDVVYTLAFELTAGDTMAVAFHHLRPQLDLLKDIYREVHDLVAADKGVLGRKEADEAEADGRAA